MTGLGAGKPGQGWAGGSGQAEGWDDCPVAARTRHPPWPVADAMRPAGHEAMGHSFLSPRKAEWDLSRMTPSPRISMLPQSPCRHTTDTSPREVPAGLILLPKGEAEPHPQSIGTVPPSALTAPGTPLPTRRLNPTQEQLDALPDKGQYNKLYTPPGAKRQSVSLETLQGPSYGEEVSPPLPSPCTKTPLPCPLAF